MNALASRIAMEPCGDEAKSNGPHAQPNCVRLKNVVTTTVVPPAQSGGQERATQLTDLDLMMLEIYTPLLLLFDRPKDGASAAGTTMSFSQTVEGLKESLSKALVEFYPLAGRLVHSKEDGLACLLCNDAGAVFTSAEVDSPMREACGLDRDCGFQALPWLCGMAQAGIDCSKLFQEVRESGQPCLVVQVTGFRCGGLAVAANWIHTVADGYSGMHFMQSWTEISRGLEQPTLVPDHGRSQVMRAAKLYDPPSAAVAPDAVASVLWRLRSEPLPTPRSMSNLLRVLEYSQEGIERLRTHISSTATDLQFSTVDCITAHLWQTVTRARVAAAQDVDGTPLPTEPLYYTTYADARRKRKGSDTALLPAGYFGNALVVTATPATTAADLVSQPLAVAASLIRKSVQATGIHSFQFLLNLAHKHGRGRIDLGVPWPGRDFGTSSWTGFPIYDLDFWGGSPPVLATRNLPPNPLLDGFSWLLPSPSGPGNITVLLYASEAAMPHILTDPLFSAFASSPPKV